MFELISSIVEFGNILLSLLEYCVDIRIHFSHALVFRFCILIEEWLRTSFVPEGILRLMKAA